jgi:hypothetical protein
MYEELVIDKFYDEDFTFVLILFYEQMNSYTKLSWSVSHWIIIMLYDDSNFEVI